MATALLQLVGAEMVALDDKPSRWSPEVPNSARVTMGQLTSGYADYLHEQAFIDASYRDPFRSWSPAGTPFRESVVDPGAGRHRNSHRLASKEK
ncbi:hypothetical protein AAGW05_01735 [Arthrobacter sp. LAPM80]|uniref:hypothetical protein n=1 Tax=Arthrobacter sp. LAPM80 TaxID=3141788 RepID=UPI00398A5EE3